MANDNEGLTPMMRQFFEMKSKHPEALLLFRCGAGSCYGEFFQSGL